MIYVTVVGQNADIADHDWRVERSASDPTKFTVTDLATSESSEVSLSSFDFEHNSLIKMQGGDSIGSKTFQLINTENDIKFNFFYQGGKVETLVYDEAQFAYKDHMAPVIKIDTTRSILSPMPGAVVSVAVAPGDTVVDG